LLGRPVEQAHANISYSFIDFSVVAVDSRPTSCMIDTLIIIISSSSSYYY